MPRASLLSLLDLRHQISLGDVQSNYLLTTAENELGVVVAHSESGFLFFIGFHNAAAYICSTLCEHNGVLLQFFLQSWEGCCYISSSCLPLFILIFVPFYVSGGQMVPISWCEMQCPLTHAKEFRKVARVQPEYLQA